MSQRGLRIGQLAACADVTPRAIRHYHSVGLLAEPARDSSGYRRYGAADLVRLVRISRLRSLGVPLERIGQILRLERLEVGPDGDQQRSGAGPDGAPGGGATADQADAAERLRVTLLDLAGDLTNEIERLTDLRGRLLALAYDAAEGPAELLARALGATELSTPELGTPGLAGSGVELTAAERSAAELVDVLHPRGMAGALAHAAPLIDDPGARSRLRALLERFQLLTDDQVDSLAAELAAVFPIPAEPVASVDLGMTEGLVGAALTDPQRRCVRLVRSQLEARAAAVWRTP